MNENLKEVLAKNIIKLVYEFESVTGAEICEIKFHRAETTPVGSDIMKTSVYKIEFDMR